MVLPAEGSPGTMPHATRTLSGNVHGFVSRTAELTAPHAQDAAQLFYINHWSER